MLKLSPENVRAANRWFHALSLQRKREFDPTLSSWLAANTVNSCVYMLLTFLLQETLYCCWKSPGKVRGSVFDLHLETNVM